MDPLAIVTEFMAKGSLDKLVYSQEPLSEAMLNTIILGIAMGMNHLVRLSTTLQYNIQAL